MCFSLSSGLSLFCAPPPRPPKVNDILLLISVCLHGFNKVSSWRYITWCATCWKASLCNTLPEREAYRLRLRFLGDVLNGVRCTCTYFVSFLGVGGTQCS